ncbi:MAG: flagellar basal body P-ring formation chaperone FlgA [Hyphomicrobium sp.]
MARIIIACLAAAIVGAPPAHAWPYETPLDPVAEEALAQPEAQQAAAALVPVPRVTIYPGDVIREDMLVDRDFAAEGLPLPQVFTVREGLVGKVSRLTLLPNNPVLPSAVRDPFAVKQGQPAVAFFKSGALVISATALPLESGSIGDAISLRNPDSGTTIRGIVQADGTIRVGTP